MPPIDPEIRARYNRRYYEKQAKRKAARKKVTTERRVTLRVTMAESLAGRINRLVIESVAKGSFSWKTQSECITTLIIAGLKTLRDEEMVADMLPQIEFMQKIDFIQRQRKEAQGALTRAVEEITSLTSIGARNGALNYYHVTMDAANQMDPTEWRDWMIKELKAAFPQFAKGKMKGARFDTHDDKPAQGPKILKMRARR